jgi:hypothetical protein
MFCRSSTRLGQSLRIPFREDYMAIHISLVFSIIVATSVRALEISLCGFYPGLPRFAIARRMLSWVCHSTWSVNYLPLLTQLAKTCFGRIGV